MNKKILSKFIVAGLTATTLATSFYDVKPVKASTIDNNISYAKTLESNKIKAINSFKGLNNNNLEELTVIEEGNYKGIINIKTGDITHEFYNEFGEIIDSYTTNFYENLEIIDENFGISTYNNIAQNSIPYKLNSQHYTIAVYSGKQKLYAQNSRGNSKSYYLKGKYTDSANSHIKKFVDGVDKTASTARLFINTMGVSEAIAVVGYFGLGGRVTSAAMIAALKALGLGALVASATKIVGLYNNYVDARIDADHYYNAL